MGNLTRAHLVETGIWLFICIVFFGFSFEFNKTIEIYKFGATGWPRSILLLLILVGAGNLYYAWNNGSTTQKGRVGFSEESSEVTYNSMGQVIKTGFILFLPLLYAILLKPVGFYAGTPFFIALIMLAWGERRLGKVLLVTLVIYAFLIFLFMFLLNAPLPQGNVSPFYDFSAFMLKTKTQLQQLM